jgi:hypothetical protein
MIAVWLLVSEAEDWEDWYVENVFTGTGHKLGALQGIGDTGVEVVMIG